MEAHEYYWVCPNCGTKVDAIDQICCNAFDEKGEAEFAVEEGCGIWLHTIFCPRCDARWQMKISGMIL